MSPTIRLLHLMMRVERDTEAQRRPDVTYKGDLVAEKPVRLPKQDNHVEDISTLHCYPQQCEFA